MDKEDTELTKEFERVGFIEEKRLKKMKHSIIIILASSPLLLGFLSQNQSIRIIVFMILIPIFIVILYRDKKSQIDPLDRDERTYYELCRVLNALQGFLLERNERNQQTTIRRIKRLSSYFEFWAKKRAPTESIDTSLSIGTNLFDIVLPLIKQIHVKKPQLLKNKLKDLELISFALEKLVVLSYHRDLKESNLVEFNNTLKTFSQYKDYNKIKLFFLKYKREIGITLGGIFLIIGYAVIQLFIPSVIKNDVIGILTFSALVITLISILQKIRIPK